MKGTKINQKSLPCFLRSSCLVLLLLLLAADVLSADCERVTRSLLLLGGTNDVDDFFTSDELLLFLLYEEFGENLRLKKMKNI